MAAATRTATSSAVGSEKVVVYTATVRPTAARLRMPSSPDDEDIGKGRTVRTGDLFVALALVPAEERNNRNVYGFDSNTKRLVWTVEESPYAAGTDNPYMSLWLADDARVLLADWKGIQYALDPDSGKVAVVGFRRF